MLLSSNSSVPPLRAKRIEVNLRNRSYTLGYRRGYYATDTVLGTTRATMNTAALATAETGDPLTPLMRSGMASATQLQYEVRVQPVTPQPADDAAHVGGNAKVMGPVTRYRADFMIHREAAGAVTASDGTRPEKMQVEVIAYDQNGKALNWQAGAMNLTTTRDVQAQGAAAIPAHMVIDVPKDAVSLVTGVYDWSTNKAGTREILMNSLPLPATGQPPATASARQGSAPASAPALLQRTPEVIKETVKAARHIHLDVVITDASGHAVSGLEQSDFTVLDDNRAQPLASFHAAGGLTAEPPVEVVLVLDTMNTSFQQMAAVRQGVEKFLRQNGGHLALPVSAIFLTDTGIKANQATRDGNALAADIERLPMPMHVINTAQGLDGLMLRFGRSVDALSQMTRTTD
ncbi:MAG TPA: hypothetical protein VH139_04310 [Acidobacteriaceae bacterium]|nr:hypothetical protein [Acidobacteriaceae bacterium]